MEAHRFALQLGEICTFPLYLVFVAIEYLCRLSERKTFDIATGLIG